MDLIGGYASNSDDDSDEAIQIEAKVKRADRRYLQAAPSISIMTKRKHGNELIVRMDHSTNQIITEPIQGPQAMDPHSQKVQAGEMQDNYQFDQATFKKQRKQYRKHFMGIQISKTNSKDKKFCWQAADFKNEIQSRK